VLFDNKKLPTIIRVPVRVVLNNKTISIYANNNMDSVYKSFFLEYMVLKKVDSDHVNSCFKVQDTRDIDHTASLCIMGDGLAPGDSVASARDQWVKDIHFFKEKCQDINDLKKMTPDEF